MNQRRITALRMERQHLARKANESEYGALYRDTQPGQNVYWNGFGDPPSLTYRADFDDVEFNRERQRTHALIKGRFAGGALGWIVPEDLELFAAAFIKPLDKPSERQLVLLELIEREGPLTIQQMKAETGMLVKEITPALHRLQEAFLVYEDQYDGEWDRGWYKFSDMFPDADLNKYSRQAALKILLRRFAFRNVLFDADMVRSFYKLPAKEIKPAIGALIDDDVFAESEGGYLLRTDFELLRTYSGEVPKSVYAMHRSDFLVKSNEHWLKEKYPHPYPDTLYYLLIDGVFRGAAAGKFRYTPDVEDVILDLPDDEASDRREDILRAVHVLCGEDNPVKRYQGK
ncbi:MAG: hypothetical protein LBK57_09420 [Clostridiales Family XIII bacterium]|jgi:hypothetical protein|nr:hypothetical protein [Clostridiales Family XIII bacterium]